MGKILMVGLCCLDTVNYVEKYPEEDSDTRVFEQRTGLGGNVANSCVVLSQFTDQLDMCASLPQDNVLMTYLDSSKINFKDTSFIRADPGIAVPHSTVVCNTTNGSRTVLHYRGNLPEIQADEFIDKFARGFVGYSWIHFEGRNFEQIQKMMAFVDQSKQLEDGKQLKVSVELEKIRQFGWFEDLVSLADVIFVSKDFAKSRGWMTGSEAVTRLRGEYKAEKSTIICPWGSLGVYGLESGETESIFVPSVKVEAVDTLGAGDCFIAAAIWALNSSKSLQTTLQFATKVAAKKCSQKGLTNVFQEFDFD